MSKTTYRYYRLDRWGNLHLPDEVEASSDDEAIQLVSSRHPSERCEIWNGKQMIADLDPSRSRVSTQDFSLDGGLHA